MNKRDVVISYVKQVPHIRRRDFDAPLNGDALTFINYTLINLIFSFSEIIILTLVFLSLNKDYTIYLLAIGQLFCMELVAIVYCFTLRREVLEYRLYMDEALLSIQIVLNYLNICSGLSYATRFIPLLIFALVTTCAAVLITIGYVKDGIRKGKYHSRVISGKKEGAGSVQLNNMSLGAKGIILATLAMSLAMFAPKNLAISLLTFLIGAFSTVISSFATHNCLRFYYLKKYRLIELIS